jgi:cytochrome P450
MTDVAAEKTQGFTSLYQLLDPEVLANPYPLYRALRERAPVSWDRYLHAWVVTSYEHAQTVLLHYSADRTPTPEALAEYGLSELAPIATVMTRQMLFLDPPAHTRLRTLAAQAFSVSRVERLTAQIQVIVGELLDGLAGRERIDLIGDLAEPFPAIVTAVLLGVPVADHPRLKEWSASFAEVLGNFQHNPERAVRVLNSLEEMTAYFREAVRGCAGRDGLIRDLATARVNGEQLTEDEVIANIIVTMVGGQETTTNLIGNGMLTLLRHPEAMNALRADPALLASAVEEFLRFEPPSQHTARLAPSDCMLGGETIRKGQAVIAVMAAANRDPGRFPEPDRLDLRRADNRHLSFGWGSHFCFGAHLARLEARLAFGAILSRYGEIAPAAEPLVWRENLGLRGLVALPVAVAPKG